jgi:hypothetical protein
MILSKIIEFESQNIEYIDFINHFSIFFLNFPAQMTAHSIRHQMHRFQKLHFTCPICQHGEQVLMGI